MKGTPITHPAVGHRVWAVEGLREHGPQEGPKVNVPKDAGGRIVRTEKPYMTMDQLLYVVDWDTGEHSKHYFGDLLCIGPFKTLQEFEAALAGAKNCHLLRGPQGGFREFSADIELGGHPLRIEVVQEQRAARGWLEPALARLSLTVAEERLPSQRRARKA